MNLLYFYIFIFNFYFDKLYGLETSMEMRIDNSNTIDVSNDYKNEKLPLNIEDL